MTNEQSFTDIKSSCCCRGGFTTSLKPLTSTQVVIFKIANIYLIRMFVHFVHFLLKTRVHEGGHNP